MIMPLYKGRKLNEMSEVIWTKSSFDGGVRDQKTGNHCKMR